MAARHTSAGASDQQTEGVAALLRGTSLVEALRSVPFQFSGRYQYNGGASGRSSRNSADQLSAPSGAALRNPIYKLEEPVYLDDSAAAGSTARSAGEPAFTLHIDIDGTDP